MAELTRVQWAALIVQLMERGATPTTQQVADLGGRSHLAAWRLMCGLALKYPIYLDDLDCSGHPVWRKVGCSFN